MNPAFAIDLLLGLSAWLMLSTGRISLATAAFAALGAASTAAMTAHGWTAVESSATGAAAGAAAGYAGGLLLARADATRFTIASLLMGIAVPSAVSVRSASLRPVAPMDALVVAAATILLVALVIRSRDGAAFTAVAQDERAAASVGMNAAALRCLAMTISAAVAALAGGLALLERVPIDFGHAALAIDLRALAIAAIGGASNVLGPVLGEAALAGTEHAGAAFAVNAVVLDAAALLAIAIVLPGGLLSLIRPLWHRAGATR